MAKVADLKAGAVIGFDGMFYYTVKFVVWYMVCYERLTILKFKFNLRSHIRRACASP